MKDISRSPCFHPPSTYNHLHEVHSLNCKTTEGLFRNKEQIIRLPPFSSSYERDLSLKKKADISQRHHWFLSLPRSRFLDDTQHCDIQKTAAMETTGFPAK